MEGGALSFTTMSNEQLVALPVPSVAVKQLVVVPTGNVLPLTWPQVRGDLDPKKYTVRTVPALLAKTKAWDGYDDAAVSIKPAMKKLAGK